MPKLQDKQIVKRALKIEMLKHDVTVEKLQRLLGEHGYSYSLSSISSKISRGSFSASFFLQCLEAMGCKKINIEEFISVGHEE